MITKTVTKVVEYDRGQLGNVVKTTTTVYFLFIPVYREITKCAC